MRARRSALDRCLPAAPLERSPWTRSTYARDPPPVFGVGVVVRVAMLSLLLSLLQRLPYVSEIVNSGAPQPLSRRVSSYGSARQQPPPQPGTDTIVENTSTDQTTVEIDANQLALFSGARIDANQLELFAG